MDENEQDPLGLDLFNILNSDTNINSDDWKNSINLTSPASLDGGLMNLQPTTLQTFQAQESSNFGPTRFEISSNRINSLTIDPRKIEINSNEDRFDQTFFESSSNNRSIPRCKTYPLPNDSPNTFKKRMVNSSNLQTIGQKEVSNFPQMNNSGKFVDNNPLKKVELYSLDVNEQVQLKDVKIRLREDSIEDHYNKQDLCRAGNNVLKELAKRHSVTKLSQALVL